MSYFENEFVFGVKICRSRRALAVAGFENGLSLSCRFDLHQCSTFENIFQKFFRSLSQPTSTSHFYHYLYVLLKRLTYAHT